MREVSIDWDAFARRTKVRLRVSMAVANEAVRRLGLPAALSAQTGNEVTTLWLGPDQWLIVSDRESADQCAARCAEALGSLLHHTVDVSAALACARLQGNRVRELMAMGSGVDWSLQALPRHRCLRTRFARIAVIAHAVESDVIELYYDRSYRSYLQRWFAHATSDPLFSGTSCLTTY